MKDHHTDHKSFVYWFIDDECKINVHTKKKKNEDSNVKICEKYIKKDSQFK